MKLDRQALLKNKGLINIIRTGKANRYEFCDVNSVVTSDVNTVATSDVKNGFTSPYIKEKGKEKIKELRAAPDSIYLNEMMKAIPDICRPYISRKFMNECLNAKNNDRPYFLWLFDRCIDKPNPIKWLSKGMRDYYPKYLRSDHYQTACGLAEFRSMHGN